MPTDHAQASHARPKPFGEYPEVKIAGGVAEVIVDRLQSVEVKIQDRDGSGASRRESFGKVRNKRSTIVQTGQIVMLSQVAKPFFGDDAGLELCEHRRDRPERVHQLWRPLPATEFDEAEQSRGHPPRNQRCGGNRGRRDGAAFRDPTLVSPVSIVCRVQLDHNRFLAVRAVGEDGVVAGEMNNLQGIRVWTVGSRWPFRDQLRRPDVVIVVT